MNQYKKKRLKVLGRINHNNKYRYPRNPSLSYPSLEEGGAKLPTGSSFFCKFSPQSYYKKVKCGKI